MTAIASRLAPEGVRVAPQPTPVEQIPARLAEAHVGVVPTLRDDFTELLLPVKMLEYVHMGLPVVASRLPVIERYFGDDVLLAEPGDPASIAAAISAVRADPEAARERGRRAARRLAQIEWRRQKEGYLELIDDLVGRSRARGG
jgi:glycosyltransferase involved in cell wall biosynthesis